MNNNSNLLKNQANATIYEPPKWYQIFWINIILFFKKINGYFNKHELLGFIIKRVVFGYLLVLFAVFIFFIVIRSCVSDIQFAPLSKQGLSPAEVAEQTQMELERYHLNGSVVGQAFHYLYNIIPFFPKVIDGKFTLIYFEKTCTSNFGAVAGADLGNIFATAMPTSLAIGGIATIFAYLIGVPLGIFSAQHKNKKGDVIITSFSNFLVVVPSLIVVLVVFVYSTMNGMSGTYELGSFWSRFWPVVAIVIMIFPAIVIRTRRFVFDEMSNEYVRFYQACGLSNSKIFYKYIFRVAGVKIIRDIPLDLIIALFGASILTENQWGIPGMGKYINDAFSDNKKDIYFVMGYATLVATFTIFSKIIADIIAALLDKRLVLK